MDYVFHVLIFSKLFIKRKPEIRLLARFWFFGGLHFIVFPHFSHVLLFR